MTGYGRGRSCGKVTWEVELKSINHRFLEIYVKLPRQWFFFGREDKKLYQGAHKSGADRCFRKLFFGNVACRHKN
ncbi:hypothetical protein L1766_02345 [Thermovorax subterraneus]|nr:hypothetical protein [Thermovorax subterraneus]